jgi:predicted nucleic acid-binding protein
MTTAPRKADRIFLDTSVLVDGLVELRRATASQRLWTAITQERLAGALTAWHCCLEFYSVLTRLPEEFRLSAGNCLRLVEEEIVPRLEIADLPPRSRLPFLRTAAAERIAGGRIYDAHIGEVARLAGATIVATQNRRHFTSLLRHGVRVLTAEELAELSAL